MITIRHHYSGETRDEIRVHHRHVRNELWSTSDAMSFPICTGNSWLARFFAVSLCVQTRLVSGSSRTGVVEARRWLEFRIVFESAGLFHGEVINAGSRLP